MDTRLEMYTVAVDVKNVAIEVVVVVIVVERVDEVRLRHLQAADTTSHAK